MRINYRRWALVLLLSLLALSAIFVWVPARGLIRGERPTAFTLGGRVIYFGTPSVGTQVHELKHVAQWRSGEQDVLRYAFSPEFRLQIEGAAAAAEICGHADLSELVLRGLAADADQTSRLWYTPLSVSAGKASRHTASALSRGDRCAALLHGVDPRLLKVRGEHPSLFYGEGYRARIAWLASRSDTSSASLEELRDWWRETPSWPDVDYWQKEWASIEEARALALPPDSAISSGAVHRALRSLARTRIEEDDWSRLLDAPRPTWSWALFRAGYPGPAFIRERAGEIEPSLAAHAAALDTLSLAPLWFARVRIAAEAISGAADVGDLAAFRPSSLEDIHSAAILLSALSLAQGDTAEAVRRIRALATVGLQVWREGYALSDMLAGTDMIRAAAVAMRELEGRDASQLSRMPPWRVESRSRPEDVARRIRDRTEPEGFRWMLLADVRRAEICFGRERLPKRLAGWRQTLLPSLSDSPEGYLLAEVFLQPYDQGRIRSGGDLARRCRTLEAWLHAARDT